MKKHLLASLGLFCLLGVNARAETKVTVDYHNNDEAAAAFAFKSMPSPSTNDAAATAKFSMVDGDVESYSGGLDKLRDGKLPTDADQPEENFFFDGSPTDGCWWIWAAPSSSGRSTHIPGIPARVARRFTSCMLPTGRP